MESSNSILGTGGIHHIAMNVHDFDASVRFYTQYLGFKTALTWGEGDGRAVMLDTGDGSYLELFAGGKKDKKPEGALLHAAMRCNRVDEVIRSVQSAGMRITVEPMDVTMNSNPPKSLRIAFFEGPDGEIIELFHDKG